MNRLTIPQNMKINAEINESYSKILTTEAMLFVYDLASEFESRRQQILKTRIEKAQKYRQGALPCFLSETESIRKGNWQVASLPKEMDDRRVEITGPVDRKMIINALNSGASVFMADFEDSNTPLWSNQINGQINLYDAVRKTITLTSGGKNYQLGDKIATLFVRPRGWHLDEKHVLIDGQPISASIFDFALYFYHNAQELIDQGCAPFFYLPKLESHLEARLWNDIFVEAQNKLSIPQSTIKATVLIETILAAFEMDEILYELKDHSAGLNAGRWDYIFSCIKKFSSNKDFCLADRSQITMTVPFMRAYALLLLKTCHKRGAPAIGGMSAYIPVKSDPVANEKAMAQVKADKDRDANDGYDGGWVAHPGLVELAMNSWNNVLAGKTHQREKQRDDIIVNDSDLLNFQPESPITEKGLRNNISVAIQYLGSWLNGNGCVPINNLMEDAATAEISRSQLWQWIRSEKGILEDGQRITLEMCKKMIAEELINVKEIIGEQTYNLIPFPKAAQMLEQLISSDQFIEFLTLPAYEMLEG